MLAIRAEDKQVLSMNFNDEKKARSIYIYGIKILALSKQSNRGTASRCWKYDCKRFQQKTLEL